MSIWMPFILLIYCKKPDCKNHHPERTQNLRDILRKKGIISVIT